MQRDTVDVDRYFGGGLLVHVENRHLGAGFRQHARGGGAEARSATGDDCGVSTNVHAQFTCAVRAAPATMTWDGDAAA